MTNPIEAVARGLCNASGDHSDNETKDGTAKWRLWEFDAKALLKALSENITDDMLDAAHNEIDGGGTAWMVPPAILRNALKAAIAAAREE